jgi:hypothetical protein
MSRLARFSKALAAFIGALAGLSVAFGFDLTGEQTAALLLVVETGFVLIAPANAPPASDTGKPAPGDPERLPGA